MKRHSTLYVYCYCHQLNYVACIEDANATAGTEHVCLTLINLWNSFHYFLKCEPSLKEVQKVLDSPELRINLPSDTYWLAHK